jgi:hypothetical protein
LGLGGQFLWNCQNKFACKLCIYALLARLDFVPKLPGSPLLTASQKSEPTGFEPSATLRG